MAHPEAQAEIDRLGLLVQGFQREDHMNRTYRATEALLRSVPSFSDDNTALFRDHEVTLRRYYKTRETYLVDEGLKKNCLLEWKSITEDPREPRVRQNLQVRNLRGISRRDPYSVLPGQREGTGSQQIRSVCPETNSGYQFIFQ